MRLCALTTLLATAPAVFGQLEQRDSRQLAIPLIYNDKYAPTVTELLSSVALKFGILVDSPLLRDLPLLGKRDENHVVESHHRHARRRSRDRKRGLLDLNLGINLPGLLGINIKLNLGKGTIVDEGWNTKVTRLSNSQSDNAWFANIGFGTPDQTLVMFIDSGSADTIVFDKSCSSCDLSSHTPFVHTKSRTFTRTNLTFATEFGDGTAFSGMLGRDVVTITPDLAIRNQLIGLLTKRTGGTADHLWDGLLGIGPDQLSFVEGNVTPLSNLVKSGQIDKPLVGVLLVKADKSGSSPGGGEYRWGGINQAYVRGSIIYTPVTSSYYWGSNMDGIYVQNKQMLGANDPGRALFDTGTTLIYTSTTAANNIHARIPGSNYRSSESAWYVPCDTKASPNVFFKIQGHRWGVPASDIAFRASGRNDGLCVSGIQGGSDTFTILGDVFIKNHCKLQCVQEFRNLNPSSDIVFDYGNAQNYKLSIGIANRTDIPVLL